MRNHLIKLRDLGVVPSTILDIGANVGNFTKMCKTIWPISKSVMIEGNKECQFELSTIGDPYFISLLGDEDGKEVTFFKSKEIPKGTGNSIYREKTSHFDDENLIRETHKLITLDTLLNDQFVIDFAKLDTQGSELDILRGGLKTIEYCKYILLEVSIKAYNENAPLKEEVVNFMQSIGYKRMEIIEQHIWQSNDSTRGISKNEVYQEDILFLK